MEPGGPRGPEDPIGEEGKTRPASWAPGPPLNAIPAPAPWPGSDSRCHLRQGRAEPFPPSPGAAQPVPSPGGAPGALRNGKGEAFLRSSCLRTGPQRDPGLPGNRGTTVPFITRILGRRMPEASPVPTFRLRSWVHPLTPRSVGCCLFPGLHCSLPTVCSLRTCLQSCTRAPRRGAGRPPEEPRGHRGRAASSWCYNPQDAHPGLPGAEHPSAPRCPRTCFSVETAGTPPETITGSHR